MKPLISVCMIVKNEEKVLRRCLESINGIADEIIIADTGSSDRTKQIAYEYTNMVYDYKWEDNFSKARNFAASKATGEWIIVIDADEYVYRDSFLRFKESLKDTSSNSNILAVQIVNFVGVNGKDTALNYHERIYKNDGTIYYYRNIHEMLKHKEAQEKRGFAQLQFFHSGYMQNIVKEKGKSKRNLTLLRNKLEKEPIDYYFLGNEYYQLGDLNKAIKYYKKGYQLKKNINQDWVLKLLVRLINCLHDAERNKEAIEVIKASENLFPQLVDFKFLKGKICFEEGNKIEATRIFKEILLTKDELRADSSIDYLEYLPNKYLGELYEKEELLQLAVHHYSKALSINDADDSIWIRLITLLANHSTLEELIQFIESNISSRENMTTQRLIKIFLEVSNLDVQKLTRLFLDEESLSKSEKESLFLKNLLLDGDYLEMSRLIGSKNINEFIPIFESGMLTIIDFICLTIETKNKIYRNFLFDLKIKEGAIGNLLNLIFHHKANKLSSFEERIFILLFKQLYLLQKPDLVELFNEKKRFLSDKGKKLLEKEMQ